MTHVCMVSCRPPEGPLILDNVSFASLLGHSLPRDEDTLNWKQCLQWTSVPLQVPHRVLDPKILDFVCSLFIILK